MIDAWWLAPAIAAGFIAGLAITLVVAATIKTRPMDTRTYTGDLGPLDDADQFFRDLNKKRDTA